MSGEGRPKTELGAGDTVLKIHPVENRRGSRTVDLTGKTFEHLEVLGYSHHHRFKSSTKIFWRCRCLLDGNITLVCTQNLIRKRTTSCGCVGRLNFTGWSNKHGDAGSYKKNLVSACGFRKKCAPEYSTWLGIKNRCLRPSCVNYKHYGGRGIKVCLRWVNSYADFLSDMGRKPGPNYSIDRIDNDGNYEPNNCRWATAKEQASNKRRQKCKFQENET